MNDPKVTEAVELLKSRDLKKRMTALDLAQHLEGREALALLLKSLHDQSWTLRDHAIPKIIAKGPQATAPILRHLTSGVWFTRAALAQVLQTIGDYRAAVPLYLLLGDSNKSVAEEAQKALKAIVSRAAPEKLAEQAGSLTMDQRRNYLEYLKKEFPNQLQIFSRIQDQDTAVSSAEEDDPKIDSGASLQQLRKAVKAALKQSSDVEYDEF
jgi:HEAT repeat protein